MGMPTRGLRIFIINLLAHVHVIFTGLSFGLSSCKSLGMRLVYTMYMYMHMYIYVNITRVIILTLVFICVWDMSQTMLDPFNSIVSGTCLGHLRHIWNQALLCAYNIELLLLCIT